MSEEKKDAHQEHMERVNAFVAGLVDESIPAIRQKIAEFLEKEASEHEVLDVVAPANFSVAAVSAAIMAEHFADFSAQGAFSKEEALGRFFDEFKNLYTAFFNQRYGAYEKLAEGEESGDALP